MQEKIIPKEKRFIPIKRYCELSGLSYATVNHMMESGQLSYITTESGLRRIDTKDFSSENIALYERLERTEKMLSALCKQFNVAL